MDIMTISLEHCFDCKCKLKTSARARVKPCLCPGCKGKYQGTNNDNSLKMKHINTTPVSPPTAEELIEIKEAWKAQNLKVDEMDRVVR
tara:strand:- start:53 stop:316 length:264 start_codon:yes stop_codon:yes gene_type:complete